MTFRPVFWIAFAGALLSAFGCGGGSSSTGGVGPAAPSISCTSAAPSSNTIGMTCGVAMQGDTQMVNVVVVGDATGNTAVRGFSFDVVYDPAVLVFVAAASYVSPLMPSPPALPPLVSRLNGIEGHLVVSIQEPGTTTATIPPGSNPQTILSLSFQRNVGAGTFGPTPLTLSNVAVNPQTLALGSVNNLALAYQ